MADVTISQLTKGIPSGNALLPFSTGSNTLTTPISTLLTNTGTSLNTLRIIHSSSNTNAATSYFGSSFDSSNFSSPSPTFTDLVQTGDSWSYSYRFFANTGGYSDCPNKYFTFCPIQKNFTYNQYSPTFGTIEFFGTHRGIWATEYGLYHKFNVGIANDSGGITLVNSQRGTPGTIDGPTHLRHLGMDKNGIITESASFGTNIGVNLGNSFYGWYHPYGEIPQTASQQIPFLFKIYASCGSDYSWYVKVTTTNPYVLGPPFKGAVLMAPNTMPTQAMYLNL